MVTMCGIFCFAIRSRQQPFTTSICERMTTKIALEYKLVGKGWAECVLDFYGSKCTVTASYLSDALLELVSGTNHILSGGTEAKFSFDEGPGEFRWILRRTAEGGLAIKILEFADLWGSKPDEEGTVVLDITCLARDFSDALLVSLNELLDEYGLDGYRDKWAEAGFPVAQYQTLCEHLGELPSSYLKSDKRKLKRSKQ